MLNSLTVDEQQLLGETCKEWNGLFSSIKEIDKPKFKEGIDLIYEKLLHKPKPHIVYCDSWVSCMFLINSLQSEVRTLGNSEILDLLSDELRTLVGNHIIAPVAGDVAKAVSLPVSKLVTDTIMEKLTTPIGGIPEDFQLVPNIDLGWDSVYNSVSNSFDVPRNAKVIACTKNTAAVSKLPAQSANEWNTYWNSIFNRALGSINNHSNSSSINNTSILNSYKNFSFCAYYDFFGKIGITNRPIFKIYKSLIQAGAFQIYEFENTVFAIQPPTEIHRNERGQLHNTKAEAITFKDSSFCHYLNGRQMPPRIFSHAPTKELLLNEPNEDVKAGIISIIKEGGGEQALLDFLGAVVVDKKEVTHFEGYTEIVSLYKTTETYSFLVDRHGTVNQPYCWSGFKCPSTGSEYLIENSADFTDAIEAMKFLRPSFVPEDLLYNWLHSAN